MYKVMFDDTIHGLIDEDFDDFNAAADFWQSYADTPTCFRGLLEDMENGEIIWSFTPEDEACE